MVQISPFLAIRPAPEHAEKIISVPYDVVNTEEARQIADGNSLSFLHVVRSEIDFPAGTDPYSDKIYDRARDNLAELLKAGKLFRDTEDCFYIYRLNQGEHQQTGLVARTHADDYEQGRIKKHELTREVKERDRTRHVDHLNANTGPVLLTFRSRSIKEITEILNNQADSSEPIYDVQREAGVRHRIYRMPAGEQSERLQFFFSRLDALYIADGHHRAASAASVCRSRREKNGNQHTGKEAFNWFLSVSFPDEQLLILPYNRAIKDLNNLTAASFREKVSREFEISPGKAELHLHELNMYISGQWYHLKARSRHYEGMDETGSLDVSILQEAILSPFLGINDPRSSDRIQFVGGIRGDEELERLVDSGEFAVAFSLFPVSTEQLLSIADAGKIMPPKST